MCLAQKASDAQCSLDRECMSNDCDDATHVCVAKAPTCTGR